jgi:hypothetical protein
VSAFEKECLKALIRLVDSVPRRLGVSWNEKGASARPCAEVGVYKILLSYRPQWLPAFEASGEKTVVVRAPTHAVCPGRYCLPRH